MKREKSKSQEKVLTKERARARKSPCERKDKSLENALAEKKQELEKALAKGKTTAWEMLLQRKVLAKE